MPEETAAERGEVRARRQGSAAPRRDAAGGSPAKAGTAVAGPATSKETRSGSAACEGRQTPGRRPGVPAPGAAKQDRQGLRSRETRQGAALGASPGEAAGL